MKSIYEFEKTATSCERAVLYIISVWDEVTPGWRERPDHVGKKFIEAEAEITEKRKQPQAIDEDEMFNVTSLEMLTRGRQLTVHQLGDARKELYRLLTKIESLKQANAIAVDALNEIRDGYEDDMTASDMVLIADKALELYSKHDTL